MDVSRPPQDLDTRAPGSRSATASVRIAPAPAVAATDYLLMSRTALLARPVSGTAWNNMREAAQHPGPPNLCDPDDQHHLGTLAAALIYARTGVSAYGSGSTALDDMSASDTGEPRNPQSSAWRPARTPLTGGRHAGRIDGVAPRDEVS